MQRRTVLSAAAIGLVASSITGALRWSMPNGSSHEVTQVYRALAEARRRAGLTRLIQRPLLDTLAQNHAAYLQKTGHLTHLDASENTPDRHAARLGYTGHILGQALAETHRFTPDTVTYWLADTATHEVLMDHRARDIGLAMTSDTDGKIWWVAIFGTA
ncbi:MAG: CAP domain-containing protein [Tateyamaria sp.]|uniref:CAP domain-containing protein n=1 Tax=Tateyamaria sp. TaxID=1929288 RepID=UPI00327DFAC0